MSDERSAADAALAAGDTGGTAARDDRVPSRVRRRLLGAAAAAGPLVIVRRAGAQEAWPSRPVTLVSPYNPGGTNDVVARLAADHLTKALGQPFVVANRPGAGGIIGVKSVIASKPDGYTLLSGNNGCLVIQSAGRVPSPYDPAKQTTPVVRLADAAAFVAISSKVPATTLAEFVAYAKSVPGKLNYSSAGVGSFGQFLCEYLKLKAGLDMVHVPGKGSAAALLDLVAGRIELMIDPQVLRQAGNPAVRILATLADARSPAYPDIPTMKEAGGPELDLHGWFGIVGPAGMPPEIVERISVVARSMAADPEVRKKFLASGLSATAVGGRAFGAQIEADLGKIADLRARANIQMG